MSDLAECMTFGFENINNVKTVTWFVLKQGNQLTVFSVISNYMQVRALYTNTYYAKWSVDIFLILNNISIFIFNVNYLYKNKTIHTYL